MTSIGAETFMGCRNLKEVIFPKGLKKIDREFFCQCIELTSIVIPEGVTEIGFSPLPSPHRGNPHTCVLSPH
ncbi:MAG: leucine-rich repeat protein [Bacteroidaceae bacterium]|nr:leucine-rich repeat protein [Bacteroidaceae bacterium]